MAYEEPAHRVVVTGDVFEIRRYEPLLVAETEVYGAFRVAANDAFLILFDYISGANRPRADVAADAPLLGREAERRRSGEKIDMTVPVISDVAKPGPSAERRFVYQFVMPAHYTLETLPEPTDSRVRIQQVPARLMAAHRFSGLPNEKNFRKHEAMLREALADSAYEPIGEMLYARYNGPFTLWFLRRNEILVEVRERRPS